MATSKNFINLGLVLGVHFYKKKEAKELHFGILNLILQILNNGWHYCFCNEYAGCEWKYGQKKYCPLCRTIVDLGDIEKRCDFAQYDFDKLCEISDTITAISIENVVYFL